MKMDAAAADGASRQQSLAEWRIGWTLVLSAMIAYGSAAVYSFSLGLFIAPLQQEFGWSRAMVSSGMLLSATLTGLAAPFAGRLIDVYGSRRIGLIGITIYCVAVAMLSTVSGWIVHWWMLWGLLACGSVFVKPTVWVTAVSKNFSLSRGIALAACMSGGGIFATITPPITHALIENFGWRNAYIGLGLGLLVLNLPLLWFFFVDRDRAPPKGAEKRAPALTGFAIRRSMLSRRYVQLGLITLVVTSAMIGTQIHFVPILSAMDISRAEAAGAMGLIGVGSIIGRLVTGFLLDRLHGPLVGGISFLIPAAAALMLLFPVSTDLLVTASITAFMFGLALGAELDILAYLTGRYFGMKNYGTLFGTLVGMMALAAGVGPMIAGTIFDLTGGYTAFLWAAVVAFLFASLLAATLGKYPDNFDEGTAVA